MFERFLCIDHEVLDIDIPVQDALPAGRPQVTVLVDPYSKEIVEYDVSFDED